MQNTAKFSIKLSSEKRKSRKLRMNCRLEQLGFCNCSKVWGLSKLETVPLPCLPATCVLSSLNLSNLFPNIISFWHSQYPSIMSSTISTLEIKIVQKCAQLLKYENFFFRSTRTVQVYTRLNALSVIKDSMPRQDLGKESRTERPAINI